QELAVCDILSLLHFALLPSDNLSLAEALRSPLFNLSEQDLFALAYGRDDKTLWQVLQEKQTDYQSTHDILRDILAHTDFLRPYEMIERILIHHGGRKKMIARLGEEIEDALDELLAQALKFETSNAASLSGFLQWFAADDLTIKRALDGQLNQIRVMTIHGAKGLESPLVILPDTAERRTPNTDKILKTDDGMLVWASRKDEASQAQLALAERNKQKRAEEELRLLYVAMTRAESWLIICGAGSRGQSGETWYDLVEAAMRGQSVAYDLSGQNIQRLETGDWQQVDAPDSPVQTPATEKPNWTQTKPASSPRPAQPLSPSRLLPDTHTEGAIDIKPRE
ncbi:MAG: double-strand break repair helicase AddA, partial [Proteobacteria bacterium]|nr:double-strand break repair helicase AddA [Pseudomonadota bacterium]